jgi:hypothetical protein
MINRSERLYSLKFDDRAIFYFNEYSEITGTVDSIYEVNKRIQSYIDAYGKDLKLEGLYAYRYIMRVCGFKESDWVMNSDLVFNTKYGDILTQFSHNQLFKDHKIAIKGGISHLAYSDSSRQPGDIDVGLSGDILDFAFKICELYGFPDSKLTYFGGAILNLTINELSFDIFWEPSNWELLGDFKSYHVGALENTLIAPPVFSILSQFGLLMNRYDHKSGLNRLNKMIRDTISLYSNLS